ncbi:MAG: DUF4129 domain-containing protein [Anaerolineales bacterium]|nr:DUF4129 domain-containing protein [Anaerolineales bacterium]
MRKLLEDKRWGLFLSILALVSLLLLVGALRNLDFRPSQPIGSTETSERSINLSAVGQILMDAAEVPLWKQLVFWSMVVLVVVLFSFFLSPELRKKLILSILRTAAIGIVFFYLIKHNPGILSPFFLNFQNINTPADILSTGDMPPPVFQPPQIPPFLSFLVTFIVILAGIALIWIVNRWWEKQKALNSASQPLKDIADIARLSLKKLEDGQDATDAIIQCYEGMSRVVGAKRGLEREYFMTPAEFASQLERAGIPREPVTRLTRLFESVRYGGHVSGTAEIDEAVVCLKSIVQYCGELE